MKTKWLPYYGITGLALAAVLAASFVLYTNAPAAAGERANPSMKIDPVTRCFHISYQVPDGAPEEVAVECAWSPSGKSEWRPARVSPLVSETARQFAAPQVGKLIERRAAGLIRTVIFNPYPEAQQDRKVRVDFRIRVQSPDGKLLSEEQLPLQADNSDVIYLEDWSRVLQTDGISTESAEHKWHWKTGMAESSGASLGNALFGKGGSIPLPQLTYPLDLRGWYAIFVCSIPGEGAIRARLSGDERTDRIQSRNPHEEYLWKWARMDHQHLILKQPHSYTGYTDAHVDYIKLVPLSKELLQMLDSQFPAKPDRVVGGYFEPYSWAFYENVQETLQHREPLCAFKEAGIQIVDIQLGRFGAKPVFETRKADQLLYGTIGDPIGDVIPETGNVGRMQQYTNTWDAEMRYSRELGMTPHANFGATNCYPGSPLQGDFSKEHPDWMRGSALRHEVPEVQDFMLGLYREALELGAPGISIDYCRYPEGVDKPQTCTDFLRKLRKLADKFGTEQGKRIPILVRFPAKGVRAWENFDYPTWAREGLVDYICPSNIQGRHQHFDITPYVKAVKGTKSKLTPVVDGLEWGPTMPGPFLWRVNQLYKAGVDGIYIYQADGRVLSWTDERRCIRIIGGHEAVANWWKAYDELMPRCSKGIYVLPPCDGKAYHAWERLRVWLEGIPMKEVEFYLDGKLVSRYDGPPYLLGTEEYASDEVIPAGEHTLKIRARDGDGWLEQSFAIKGG